MTKKKVRKKAATRKTGKKTASKKVRKKPTSKKTRKKTTSKKTKKKLASKKAEKYTASEDPKAAVTTRKKRSAFRASYRGRCEHSFGLSVLTTGQIKDELEEKPPNSDLVGYNFIVAYKYLSHSIEMLCKATLEQRSSFLLLEDLKYFNSIVSDQTVIKNTKTPGAYVALARASKLFQKKVTRSELGVLENILINRNQCEHNEFFIENFENSVHLLAAGLAIVVDIYDSQFRNGNIISTAKKRLDVEIKEIYESIIQESSDDYKDLTNNIKKQKKNGAYFIECVNCHYVAAKLNSGANSYNCLWCGDQGTQSTCSFHNCKNIYWSSSRSPRQDCGQHFVSSEIFEGYKNRIMDLALGSAQGSSLVSPNALELFGNLITNPLKVKSDSWLGNDTTIVNPTGEDSSEEQDE